jgi:hypothetical protein
MMPELTDRELGGLFGSLDVLLARHGCDNTHRHTLAWAATRGLDEEETEDLLDLLARHGGCCCDCEVLFNAEPVLLGELELFN